MSACEIYSARTVTSMLCTLRRVVHRYPRWEYVPCATMGKARPTSALPVMRRLPPPKKSIRLWLWRVTLTSRWDGFGIVSAVTTATSVSAPAPAAMTRMPSRRLLRSRRCMRGSTRMLRWWPRVLRIYDESGRAVRVRVRYLVLLLVAVGFLGFSAVYLPVAMTSVPGFCDKCHLMVEPAELWKESTHSNVNCVECHVNPGFVSEIEHKILSYKEIYAQ